MYGKYTKMMCVLPCALVCVRFFMCHNIFTNIKNVGTWNWSHLTMDEHDHFVGFFLLLVFFAEYI